MTSFERQADRLYHGHDSSEYAVLSHTWGRWQAPKRLPAIEVNGITWAVLPVKSCHFSIRDLQNDSGDSRVRKHLAKSASTDFGISVYHPQYCRYFSLLLARTSPDPLWRRIGLCM